MPKHYALVGIVKGAEIVKRRWIVTITGSSIGESPKSIKQSVFAKVMELAPQIEGAERVVVGTSKTRGKNSSGLDINRDRVPRTAKPKGKRGRRPGFVPWNKGKGGYKLGSRKRKDQRIPINPDRKITAQQAYEIYKKSNGLLSPAERTVLSHIQAWDVERMDTRSIGRQFSLGGEQKVKEIARQGWQRLGLRKVTNGFEQVS